MYHVRLGVRGKLFVISLLVVMGVGVTSGIFLEILLRSWLENRAETDLWRQAKTARDIVEIAPIELDEQQLTALVWRIGDSIGDRVTLIDQDGTLLADSEMPAGQLDHASNHQARQEFQMALRQGLGLSRRISETTGQATLYAAIPFHKHSYKGVLRVAMSLQLIEDAVARLRWCIAVAGFVGLATALFVGGVTSHFASRTLRHLVDHAESTLRGRSSATLMAWPQDEIGAVAGSFNQISEQLERVVDTLGQERNQFATLLDNMSEAVLTVNQQQRLSLINGAAISLMGMSNIPFGAKFFDSFTHAKLQHIIRKSLAGKQIRQEFTMNNRTVLARATPLPEQSGCMVVLHDITDLRHLENVRKDFIANVSHELRTPISVIRANAETLLEGGALQDPVAAQSFVRGLLRNAERLGRIVADLLDISRIEAGKYTLKCKQMALLPAIHRAVDGLAIPLQQKNIQWRISHHHSNDVYADAQALDQILLNLLDNACKYTQPGGQIHIECYANTPMVEIHVKDNGPGIPMQHAERLFERFYRIDSGRSRHVGGTGLGLSIVKHLCESMQGSISYHPNRPQGSTFKIKLYMKAPNNTSVCDGMNNNISSSSLSSMGSSYSNT